MIRLELPHAPKGKARPRFDGHHARNPDAYDTWLAGVKLDAALQYHGEPLAGPVRVQVVFYAPRRPRCDLDNALGAVLDALNGVAYHDDRQVVSIEVRWAPADEHLIVVEISPSAVIIWPTKPGTRVATPVAQH